MERLFAYEYFNNKGDGTNAAIAAGYSKRTAAQQASRLLKRVKVQEILQGLTEKLEAKAVVTKEKVSAELEKLGFVDIRNAYDEHGCLKPIKDLPADIAGAITSIKVNEVFANAADGGEVKTGQVVEVKFSSKIGSLSELSKLHGFHAPTKVTPTDPDGNPINTPVKVEIVPPPPLDPD